MITDKWGSEEGEDGPSGRQGAEYAAGSSGSQSARTDKLSPGKMNCRLAFFSARVARFEPCITLQTTGTSTTQVLLNPAHLSVYSQRIYHQLRNAALQASRQLSADLAGLRLYCCEL
ncbi:hypothetical protein SKAU_G00304140 [Synaphobranchus kaupii]|uniref:Uncharacterized protein n=1 Tax=Synaphobranchus kaupii TaxID=118154 RepID=A0A9Q1EW85_SYNKA|nr:hypothetical protein SKAU_G00304140 [Synaphobranchus kaupii]